MGISLSFLNQFTPYSIILKRNKIILHHEMEALREENSRLKRRIEAGKAVEELEVAPCRAEPPPAMEVESEYKPTGHTTGGNYNPFAS